MKFIVVTDVTFLSSTTETERKVLLNIDHIVSFNGRVEVRPKTGKRYELTETEREEMEFYMGNSRILTTQGTINVKESVEEILLKIKDCNSIA